MDILFKPELAAKFADCGIGFIGTANEVINVALNYLGLNPHSADKQDIDEAEQLLSAVRPHIRYFNNVKILDDLATGEICMALTSSGEVGLAQAYATEAGRDTRIRYGVPSEGTLIWIDSMVVLSESENKDAAHKFLDYMMRPDVIAEITNTLYYSNPNAAATPLVRNEIVGDPNIYPTEEVMRRLFADVVLDNQGARLRTRAWTKIKTGQ